LEHEDGSVAEEDPYEQGKQVVKKNNYKESKFAENIAD